MQFVHAIRRLAAYATGRRLHTPLLLTSVLLLAAVNLVACGAPAPAAPVVDERVAPVAVDAAADTATQADASQEDASQGKDAKDGTALEPPPGVETIALAELPPEALETIVLIAKGGPFPYSKDGSTFFNREGILPSMPEGYYREYTVETPGSDDRGARRIVGGEEGELYYTDDHYNSFSWIVIE
ncbi:MAG: hypothetical protein KDD83_21655 [Caldilineaceae bacterium]|nr:hypothetical protein [Caldilineaceae bacterium]